MATDYSKKTNADLVEILKSRSLPHNGKKADMVARLQEADKNGTSAVASKTDQVEDVIDWDDDAPAGDAPASATSTGNAPPTVGGIVDQVSNPAAVPNQKVDVDPSTTHDLKVGTASGNAENPAVAENKGKATDGQEGTNGTGEVADKPAVDYSIGLASTDLDAELAKRKARAEKFGIVEDSTTALQEAQKSLERAKRFGTDNDPSAIGVRGLDQALPSERRRKRGPGDDGANGNRGKRRDFRGRGRGRFGQRGRGPRNDRQGQSRGSPYGFSEQDRAAIEKRKARFG